MPYKIKKFGSGEKVTTPNHPRGFSKKPMPHKKAVAQLRAIKMNTDESLAEAVQIVQNLLSEHCGTCGIPKRKKLTRPKACNFSGVGYNGSGMHVVGGSGGLANGGMGG